MFTTVADYMLAQRMKKVLVKDDAKYRRAPPAHAVNQVVEIWWRRRVESQPPTPHMREVQQLEWWTTEVTAAVWRTEGRSWPRTSLCPSRLGAGYG